MPTDPLKTGILPEPYRPIEWVCRCGASLLAAWGPFQCPKCGVFIFLKIRQ